MNQGKMEVVKQEMARVNVEIQGISELKLTGMGEFNSDDHSVVFEIAFQTLLFTMMSTPFLVRDSCPQ